MKESGIAEIEPHVAAGGDDGVRRGDARPTALSWPKIIILLAAFCFVSGIVGYTVSERRRPAGDSVDVGFYQDMITHHEQAVEIAKLAVANGENTLVREFALEVIIFQQYEIGVMRERLTAWGYGSDRPDTAMAWMGMPVPPDAMPGLATGEQLEQLRAARGAAADALFLGLMAEHHRGGVHMASYAVTHANTSAARALAARMARNQATEINEYRQTAINLGLDVDIQPFDLSTLPPAAQPP